MKDIEVDGLEPISVHVNRRSRRLRLTFTSSGRARVSAPIGTPRFVIEKFVRSNHDWLLKHKPIEQAKLRTGVKLYDDTEILFTPSNSKRFSTKATTTAIEIRHPSSLTQEDKTVQEYAEKKIIAYLKNQADAVLVRKCRLWAARMGKQPKNITVKNIRSRWGSCSSAGHINLSVFLTQLSTQEIDYVIIHELSHLDYQHHQPSFWKEVGKWHPDFKETRKLLRAQSPRIIYSD